MGKMLEFIKKYGWNKYSQNGEDGIIQEVISRLGLKKGVAVEFGGADGFFCSNTAALREIGWKVWMYDIEPRATRVEKKAITESNVNELPESDILSIDIDGNDYFVWAAYDSKPDVVIIEVNSSIPPHENHVSSERGASYKAMLTLGELKGYFLLCHTGNMVFILNKHKDKVPDGGAEFNPAWLH
jgi:hypothetical protein